MECCVNAIKSELFCFNIYRIVFIILPLKGIGYNIFPDTAQFVFVSYNVFVIITLPDRCAGYVADDIDLFGGSGFKTTDDGG